MENNKNAQKWNWWFSFLFAWQKRDEPCVIKVKLETRTHSTNLMMSIENEIQLMEIKQSVQNTKRNRTKQTTGREENSKNQKWKLLLFFSNQFNRSQCVMRTWTWCVCTCGKKILPNYSHRVRLCQRSERQNHHMFVRSVSGGNWIVLCERENLL